MDRVDLIDDDLGVSGAAAALKQGFNRLLGLMAASAVGMVLVAESSRLARNVTDFAHFVATAQQHNMLLVLLVR
jgi:DNA invertase Pin-like site-specific DNA recombinase